MVSTHRVHQRRPRAGAMGINQSAVGEQQLDNVRRSYGAGTMERCFDLLVAYVQQVRGEICYYQVSSNGKGTVGTGPVKQCFLVVANCADKSLGVGDVVLGGEMGQGCFQFGWAILGILGLGQAEKFFDLVLGGGGTARTS